MKKAFYTLSLAFTFLAAGTFAQAQEEKSVLSGKASEHWFIGIGGGVNSIFDNGNFAPVQPAAQFNFGKWVSPAIGLRAGYNGIFAQAVAQPETWWSGDQRFNYNLVHFDALWNLRNTVTYKEKRVWNPVLYLRTGAILATAPGNGHRWAFGMGGGFANMFRVGEHVSISLDLSAVIASERLFRNNNSGRFVTYPTASLGLVFDLGHRRFRRPATPVPVPDPNIIDKLQVQLEESDARLALAQSRIGKLQKENAKLDKLQDGKTYSYKSGEFKEAQMPAPVTVSAQAEILYFGQGKTTLDERELARLEFYAQNTFKKSQKLLISGCADMGTGSREINQRLSRQRAEYVKEILVKQFGYNPALITTQSDVIPSTSPIKGRIVTIEVQ